MNDLKSAFKLACIYTGTVIGAGFASGQEIWRFFGRMGNVGLWGIILSTFLLGFIGSGILLKIYRLKINSYDEFCTVTFGNRVSGFVALIGATFMFTCFCIMLAGSGAIFQQEMGLSSVYGVAFLALVCFVTFLFDIRGVVIINSVLSPLMLIGILILGGHMVIFGDKGVMSSFSEILALNDNWAISACIYVSYNLLTIPAVIVPMRGSISSSRAALYGGGAAGVVLGIGGIIIFLVSISGKYNMFPLPALVMAGEIGANFKMYYCLVIFMAMLTSAVGCGMGFIKYISGNDCYGNIAMQAGIVCLLGSCLAMLGFTQMVEQFYTLFGYLGLFIAIILFKDSIYEVRHCFMNME